MQDCFQLQYKYVSRSTFFVLINTKLRLVIIPNRPTDAYIPLELCILLRCSSGSLQSQYVGCYYDNSSQANWIARIRDSSQMTIESCIQACTTSNATFALLQVL